MKMKTSNNFDKLDALIMLAGDVLIEKDVDYANSLDTSECKISKRIDRKIRRKIKRAEIAREYKSVLLFARRAVIMVLIICTLLFASAMSIAAVRVSFLNAFVEWCDEYISVTLNPTDDAMQSNIIAEIKELSYLPDGYEVSNKLVNDYRNEVTFTHNGIKVLKYIQKTLGTDVWIDDDGCTLRDVSVNGYGGILADYSEGETRYILMWEDDRYSYILHTYTEANEISEAELLKIAESIY